MFSFLKSIFSKNNEVKTNINKNNFLRTFFPTKSIYENKLKSILEDYPEEIRPTAWRMASEMYAGFEKGWSIDQIADHIITTKVFPGAAPESIRESVMQLGGQLIAPRISISVNHDSPKDTTPPIIKLEKQLKHQINNPYFLNIYSPMEVALFPYRLLHFTEKDLTKIQNDSDIIAVKWETSSNHNIPDICSIYKNANFWGLGKGIYPKDKIPQYPAHYTCHCNLSSIFVGEFYMDGKKEQAFLSRARFNPHGADKYLNSLSLNTQKRILGDIVWGKWKSGNNWLSYLWENYGMLRQEQKDKYRDIKYDSLLDFLIKKMLELSLPARYHFVDILEYSTFNKPYSNANDMNFYTTRQKQIDFRKTTQELLSSGLIQMCKINDPEIILNSYYKDDLINLMNNPEKLPKKGWRKKKIIDFMIENYSEEVVKLSNNRFFVDLPYDVKQVRDIALPYLKELANS